MDPGDTIDFQVDCSALVGTDDVASYIIDTPAESELYGLTIGSGTYGHSITDNVITFWLTMTESPETDVVLPVEITVTTTSTPARILQRTYGVKVTQL